MGTPALIGLGSNLGDRKATLDGAVLALAETPGITVRAVSSYHETRPVGGPSGQGAFLNAAAAVDTAVEPEALLSALHAIERRAGRVREVRWGERTLDLDLLLVGDRVINHPGLRVRRPGLQIPHPLLPFRRFVLAPAAEVASTAVDPITRRTVAGLLAHLDRRPSYVALFDCGSQRRSRVFRGLIDALAAAGLSQGETSWRDDEHHRIIPSDVDEWRAQGFDPAVAPSDSRRPRCEAEFVTWANDLRADRWTVALWGDRWIVTDFWFDSCFLFGNTADRQRVLGERVRLIEPTFVAVLRPFDRDLRVGIEDEAKPGDWTIGGAGVPILVPQATDAEGIVSEIVTACAMTRYD